eukprot:m.125712 g.125712  ORF g.125712 m.125712 type:complete len:389 (+) comp19793_c0_seq1:1458-2624(+)
MNSFIGISEEEQTIELLEHVSDCCNKDDSWLEAWKKKAEAKETAEVLKEIVSLSPSFFSSDDTGEGSFNALVRCILGRTKPPQQLQLVQQLSAQLVAPAVKGFEMDRLKVLGGLFNSLPPSDIARYFVFKDIFGFASSRGFLPVIVNQLSEVEQWVRSWGCSVDQTRDLYKLIAAGLKANKEYTRSAEFMCKHVASFNGAAAADLTKATADSLELLSVTLASPELYDASHLLALDSIKHLKGQPAHTLLDIYCRGDLLEYSKFVSAHPATLADLKLSQEEMLRKVRLMALTSLCARSTVLSFATVAERLQITEADVEPWIIDVIRAGLVEAKVDELNEKIVVTRSTHTEFGIEQWKILQKRLQAWHTNLTEVQSVLQNVDQQIKSQIR